MRISDWSSDVCSSDLVKKLEEQFPLALEVFIRGLRAGHPISAALELLTVDLADPIGSEFGIVVDEVTYGLELRDALQNMADRRSEEHTSELQSLMRISYAVFCLKKNKNITNTTQNNN